MLSQKGSLLSPNYISLSLSPKSDFIIEKLLRWQKTFGRNNAKRETIFGINILSLQKPEAEAE